MQWHVVNTGDAPTMPQVGGEPLVGKTIAGSKYQIVRMLGEGGMGTVYQARQIAMDRMVALKLIRREVVTSPSMVARFHKEMLVTAKVEHPNTIRVYDFGEHEGQLYLAMEFLNGPSLRQVADAAERFDIRRIVRIGKQVAHALGAIHALGLVHRDLKPDNVMLIESYGETDFVKVLDFGIAKSLDDDMHLTGTGSPIGTPAYMSPEQAMGRAVDARTDLYALGIMLYRMASGRVPFDAPTAGSMLIAHATVAPIPLLTLAPDTSPALARLIMQLLEKDPAARPASAGEVATRLESCLQELGSMSTLGNSTAPFVGPKRLKARLVLALAGVLAVAGSGITYLVGRSAGDPGSDNGGKRLSGSGSAAGSSPALRKELDDLLEKTEPLAPETCRTKDTEMLTRLVDAARALGDERRDKALGILGDSPGNSSEGWALLSRAQLAGDAEKAEASAAEAARLCPSYAVAHNLEGNALQKLGKAQPAEDAYVRALTVAPMYDAPRFNLGLLQLRQNDATAIGTFTELLRRRPDHPNAHLARAQAYTTQGKNAEALADLEEAVQRQPDGADAWAALGQLREHLKKGDHNAAYCRAKELGHAKAAARCNQ
jgi:serine/threonine protein kinase/Flp pilus assembly protein TadD